VRRCGYWPGGRRLGELRDARLCRRRATHVLTFEDERDPVDLCTSHARAVAKLYGHAARKIA
jgi:hypothetical protein